MADTKIARFQLPGMDRVMRFEVPADATEEQAHALISGYMEQLSGGPVKDPTADMSTIQRMGAGAGKAFMDIGRGVGQIAGAIPQQSIDQSKQLDAPLMKTGGGIAGNILGNAALFAPTAFIPGVNTYTGAAAGGAAMGALQPVATGESRAVNTAIGAGAGVGGQALGRGIGRLVKPIQSFLSPEEQQLAQAATREGIPLSAGQATGSRPMQIAESVMENLPFTSAPQLAGREAQQRAFTAAALQRAGMTGDVASAPAMLAQKKALGGRISQIAEQNTLDFNKGITDRLATIVDDAAQHLPSDSAGKVASTIDKILAQVTSKGEMAGTNYQGWREPLRSLASEGGATGRYFQQIRGALDEAFRSQLQGATAEEAKGLSRQYANLKTIIDAMGGPVKLPATGQISPAQLSGALARSVGRENKALGVGDLNELAKIGRTFVGEQIPNSGTAQRQFIQSLLTGGGGAGVGAAAGAATGNDPLKGAAMGAGVGLGGLALPRIIQMLMNSPAGQAYLKSGLFNASPFALDAITATGRAALPAAVQSGR